MQLKCPNLGFVSEGSCQEETKGPNQRLNGCDIIFEKDLSKGILDSKQFGRALPFPDNVTHTNEFCSCMCG